MYIYIHIYIYMYINSTNNMSDLQCMANASVLLRVMASQSFGIMTRESVCELLKAILAPLYLCLSAYEEADLQHMIKKTIEYLGHCDPLKTSGNMNKHN